MHQCQCEVVNWFKQLKLILFLNSLTLTSSQISYKLRIAGGLQNHLIDYPKYI